MAARVTIAGGTSGRRGSQSQGVPGVVVRGAGGGAGLVPLVLAMAAPRLALVAACVLCVLRVAPATVYFQEQFLDGEHWRNRWVQSANDSRFGHFRLSSGTFYGHKEKDKGLQTSQDGRRYALSARFPAFSSRGRALVLQFSVKHGQRLDCGGGYVKLLPADVDQTRLSARSPYYVMFGPDICGFDLKKVHVILHFQNQYHHNKKPIRCKVDAFTHLYTLVLRPDLTYAVKIDGQVVEAGSVEYDWQLTSLRSARRAAARAREQAGAGHQAQDWEKQFLDTSTSTAGEWSPGLDGAALLQKPPYQDGLRPEGISGDVWLQEERPPSSWAEFDLTEFEDIGAIGLDLWQVRSGTIFDNFLITDDEDYAERFGRATWGETKGPEREMDEVLTREELRRAQEEEEEELRAGRWGGRGSRRDGL
ncbi:calreticulin-3 isoform X1 [Erinaceus europaeus]|uniref:Calreticulin-3 isoform X1 n=1 Tax=Erinaceus europaeus TaxID=9365 RepID=A0A1S3ADB2_ERIEU|nr:calreticulin-3 isoform X1 [Erinaceus europaeus]